jgi:hypothetical protein
LLIRDNAAALPKGFESVEWLRSAYLGRWWWREQGAARKQGNDLAHRLFLSVGALLSGLQDIVVNIERRSHKMMIEHQTSDDNRHTLVAARRRTGMKRVTVLPLSAMHDICTTAWFV